MNRIEFICHTKHLGAMRKIANGAFLQVPLSLGATLRELLAKEGLTGILAILAGRRDPVDLAPLVERNLLRKRIRFERLYANPLVAWVYCLMVMARTRLSASLLASRFKQHPEARAFVFNGFLMPDALTLAIGNALGRERLVVELGFFPNTLQYDICGINFDSTLPRDPRFYRAIEPLIAHEKPGDVVKRRSKQKGQAIEALPPSYIFVPMQVPSDMQILAHSPWIRDMVHFYEVLAHLADQHPNYHFIIKEHPSFPLSIRARIRPHPRIAFANHNDTRALIEGAEAVITINSTVGLEGLLLGKKVITLGNAPYNIEGLVLRAGDDVSLSAALTALPSWQADEALRDAFIRYVYNVFLLRGDRHNPTPDMFEALLQRARRTDQHHTCLSRFSQDSRAEDESAQRSGVDQP